MEYAFYTSLARIFARVYEIIFRTEQVRPRKFGARGAGRVRRIFSELPISLSSKRSKTCQVNQKKAKRSR